MTTTYTQELAAVTALTAANLDTATLGAGKDFLGGEYDNSTGKFLFVSLRVLYQMDTPTAGAPLNFYILYAIDGTNYEDGTALTNDGAHNASPAPSGKAFVDRIPLTADATAHQALLKNIPLMQCKFKILVNNGDAAKGLNTTHLFVYPYGHNIEMVG